MLVRLVLACHQIKRTTCPWAGWVLTCPTVGRWPACLACHQIGHQIKRTTCPWA